MHEHHDCPHELRFCGKCDEAYCTTCKAVWQRPCTKPHYFGWTWPNYAHPSWLGGNHTLAVTTKSVGGEMSNAINAAMERAFAPQLDHTHD